MSTIAISCDEILNSVRSTNLNFSCQETPFSLYLTIRKSLVKFNHAYKPPAQANVVDNDNASDNLIIVEENIALKNNLKRLENELEISRNISKTLESKVEAAEATLFKHYKEIQQCKDTIGKKDDENKALKNVIKNNNLEMSKNNGDLNGFKKILKVKEKDIHNLETKNYNLQETIVKSKEASSKPKEDKRKLEKEIKKLEKKPAKSEDKPNPVTSLSSNISTSTTNSFSSSIISSTFTNASSDSLNNLFSTIPPLLAIATPLKVKAETPPRPRTTTPPTKSSSTPPTSPRPSSSPASPHTPASPPPSTSEATPAIPPCPPTADLVTPPTTSCLHAGSSQASTSVTAATTKYEPTDFSDIFADVEEKFAKTLEEFMKKKKETES